jgi:hypothetical protein
MGIAGVEPRQLAPTVGTTGAGSTDSPAQHQPCHRGTASMLIGVSIQSPLSQIDCPSSQLFIADLTCLVFFCVYAHRREIKSGRIIVFKFTAEVKSAHHEVLLVDLINSLGGACINQSI